jgi:hypothetical protein
MKVHKLLGLLFRLHSKENVGWKKKILVEQFLTTNLQL